MTPHASVGDLTRKLIDQLHQAEHKAFHRGGPAKPTVPLRPPMDVYVQDDGQVFAVLEVAGVKRDDIEVTLDRQQNLLTISGYLEKPGCEKQDGHYAHRECSYGRFVRELTVDSGTNQSDVKVKLDKGVLQIELPKSKDQLHVSNIKVE